MITGILVALPEELHTLTKRKIEQGQCVAINKNILVCVSGAGPVNAKMATQKLIAHGATNIISWGCAAALAADLHPGDLTIVQQLIAASGEQLNINTPWLQATHAQLAPHVAIRTGSLLESQVIVADSVEKKYLAQKSRAQVLDMESFASAAVAEQDGIPFMAIRVIADTLEMDLPSVVVKAMDEHGKIQFGKLLLGVIMQPEQLIELIKLGRYFRQATNTLKLVASHLDIIVNLAQPHVVKPNSL